eukprot:Plantae.Rhodophyta-Purpureofilum_apyrenoidigerum.ctg23918.p1 GENE.Plantae.Rhodophyta-Purpureofilum_apyrenoidigerum.ctg23918~~Plantae.Rhodophyta-Purpureofilum_apyrenoidigerum.ctg23918.p1  ORF type:complete len:490 (+),score=75.09 Plantae.Rhodophyta-Purpureofilum_apyrenoidigerum.ctg23918:76-1470(+)
MGVDVDMESGQVLRKRVTYAASDRFVMKDKKFSQQYSQVYYNRLNMQRKDVFEAARRKWNIQDEGIVKDRLLKVQVNEPCVVVGLLFKEMKLKPSILREYAKSGGQMMPNPPQRTEKIYADESDKLVLEDETGRTALDLSQSKFMQEDCEKLVSGFVVAVKGAESAKGIFIVDDICPVTSLPQLSSIGDTLDEDVYICLVSGLSFGEEVANPLRAELLLETLKGSSLANETDNASLTHVVIAGNSICRAKDASERGAYLKAHVPLRPHEQQEASQPIRELDRFLCSLASAVPLELMPGEHDPVSHMLPKQPVHPCLLPDSTKFMTLTRATNPHEFTIGGRAFLGTCGENVDDYLRYLPSAGSAEEENEQRLRTMENMLRFGHTVPTAPDTLTCYPFQMKDPFVLKTWPNVFFAGNQPTFGTRLVTEGERTVRIVSVPSFASSGQVVILNLRTLEPYILQIDTRF